MFSRHPHRAHRRPNPFTRRIATAGLGLIALACSFAFLRLAVPTPATAEPTPPPADFHTPAPDSVVHLEPFDYPEHKAGLPAPWEARKGIWGSPSATELYYTLAEEDGNQYLSAETHDSAIDAGRPAEVNLRVHNILRWRWRVWSLPVGANEEKSELNDSGAAVRIVFQGGLRARMLKYVWSSTLPKGTETESAGNGKIKVIVLQSGTENLGKWVWEEVNAYEDYKRLFGGEPRPVRILGVITDANNTKTLSKADYDDFTFIVAPPPEPEEEETTHGLQDEASD